MRHIIFAGLAGASLLMGGCAQKQFVKGHGLDPSETVLVVTNPEGAHAITNYGNECTTPCYLPLLTKKGGEITISSEGHRTERYLITSSVSDARVAHRSLYLAGEAIDPDPVSAGVTLLAYALDGKGGVMELDTKNLKVDLVRLEEGEEDVLADAAPLTGERIPIDLSEPASE